MLVISRRSPERSRTQLQAHSEAMALYMRCDGGCGPFKGTLAVNSAGMRPAIRLYVIDMLDGAAPTAPWRAAKGGRRAARQIPSNQSEARRWLSAGSLAALGCLARHFRSGEFDDEVIAIKLGDLAHKICSHVNVAAGLAAGGGIGHYHQPHGK